MFFRSHDPHTTALPRDDIDSVDAIVILPYREPALRPGRTAPLSRKQDAGSMLPKPGTEALRI